MGDVTWLSSLGPWEITSLALGLVAIGLSIPRWVVKAIVEREQQISREYRTAYLTEADRGDRAMQIAQQQTEVVGQLTVAVHHLAEEVERMRAELAQPLGGTGRHRSAG